MRMHGGRRERSALSTMLIFVSAATGTEKGFETMGRKEEGKRKRRELGERGWQLKRASFRREVEAGEEGMNE